MKLEAHGFGYNFDKIIKEKNERICLFIWYNKTRHNNTIKKKLVNYFTSFWNLVWYFIEGVNIPQLDLKQITEECK